MGKIQQEGNHALWYSYPNRMLRHRALIQCIPSPTPRPMPSASAVADAVLHAIEVARDEHGGCITRDSLIAAGRETGSLPLASTLPDSTGCA